MAEGDGRPPRRRPYDYGVPSDYDDYDSYDGQDGHDAAGSGQYDGWSWQSPSDPYGQQAPYGQQPGQYDQFGQQGQYAQQAQYGQQPGQYGEYPQPSQYGQPDQYGSYSQYGGRYGQSGGQYGGQYGQESGAYANGYGTSGHYGSYDHAEPYQYQYAEPYDYTGQSAGPMAGRSMGQQQPQQQPPRQQQQSLQQQPPQQPEPFEAWPGPPSGAETMQLRRPYSAPGPFDEDTDSDDSSSSTADSSRTVRPTGGRAERRRQAKRIKRRRRLSATREIPILIGVALAIAVILKSFLVQAFVIPSGSMEQTIRIGDRVLVDKLTPWFGSEPERGDVVVFEDPGGWLTPKETKKTDPPFGVKQGKDLLTAVGLLPSDNEQDLIKRTVGVGGDHVRCCDNQGRVTVNGTPLKEPYLHPGNHPSDLKFDVHVPPGRIFVMGDHRNNSADSRYHLRDSGHGTVSEDRVLGRAVVIAWPFGHWRRLEEPKTYASVPSAGGSATAASGTGANPLLSLPSPAELPLVMGVVGLSRLRGRRQLAVRSDRAGLGGRRSARFWRRRWRRRREWGPGSRTL